MRLLHSPQQRRLLLLAFAVIGIANALLIIRPWARDQVSATDMAVAAEPRVGAAGLPAAQALISVGKTQLLAEDDQREMRTALMFMSYFLLSTRGLAEKCVGHGIDVRPYSEVFAREHRAEYDRASRRLAGHGMNAEIVWTFFADQIAGLASGHIAQYARAHGGDEQRACRRLVEEPALFAGLRAYDANYPQLHARLMAD
jgi:hypothetical protein